MRNGSRGMSWLEPLVEKWKPAWAGWLTGQLRSKTSMNYSSPGCYKVVNNVISLASVPVIFSEGADHYKNFGQGRSLGTLTIQLAGNVRHGGLTELAFGITLRELLENYGQGTSTGKPARAVQVGGPLGAYLPESQWDTPLDYEAFIEIGAMLGHGGLVVFDDTDASSASASRGYSPNQVPCNAIPGGDSIFGKPRPYS